MTTLYEKAAKYMDKHFPESDLIAGCLDVSILYDGIHRAFIDGYKLAKSELEESDRIRLELENTEFDYGHNVDYKSLND